MRAILAVAYVLVMAALLLMSMLSLGQSSTIERRERWAHLRVGKPKLA